MRKSRFTEAQIIGMIKEQEAGLPTAELCRQHGLSLATFYKLKAKYGGMDLSLLGRKPTRLVTVAIANKTARTAWAMLVRQEDYRASAMA